MIVPGAVSPNSIVEVYFFQRWRPAIVIRTTPTRVLVQYLTPKGVKRVREVWLSLSSDQIRERRLQ